MPFDLVEPDSKGPSLSVNARLKRLGAKDIAACVNDDLIKKYPKVVEKLLKDKDGLLNFIIFR